MMEMDGVPLPRRYWAALTVALGVTMAVLDASIANVALPVIARDLQASPAGAIWVVNAYQLTVMVLLLPLASAGDIIGYRRVYRVGLALFTVASVACALSDSLLALTLARVVQGIGAAGIMSVNSALVRFIYPRHLLGRGIGITALVVAVSSALGPTVASAILSMSSWPWLFAVNLPVGAAALVACRALPRTPRVDHRFDVVSAVLSALTFGLLIVAIDGVGHGENRNWVVGEITLALVAGVVLVRRQLSRPNPLLPVDLLRRPIFALSLATSISAFMAQMLAYVALHFHLQYVLGRDAVTTGLLMTPWPLATAVAAPIAGRLADRYPAGILGGIGLLVFAAGLALLAFMPAAPSDIDIALRMAVCGIGFGLFQSPNNRTIIGSAPPERSGGASGMLGTARLLGQTTGAAFVAFAFTVAPDHATVASLSGGAAVALVAAIVSCLRLMDREGEALVWARTRKDHPKAGG
jgi:DHA2 family multidrug resistance protein-like MFS transporter